VTFQASLLSSRAWRLQLSPDRRIAPHERPHGTLEIGGCLPSSTGDCLWCRYYNAELHKAAFVLPQFAVDALDKSMTYA